MHKQTQNSETSIKSIAKGLVNLVKNSRKTWTKSIAKYDEGIDI